MSADQDLADLILMYLREESRPRREQLAILMEQKAKAVKAKCSSS